MAKKQQATIGQIAFDEFHSQMNHVNAVFSEQPEEIRTSWDMAALKIAKLVKAGKWPLSK